MPLFFSPDPAAVISPLPSAQAMKRRRNMTV
jgi:hypothetical protein